MHRRSPEHCHARNARTRAVAVRLYVHPYTSLPRLGVADLSCHILRIHKMCMILIIRVMLEVNTLCQQRPDTTTSLPANAFIATSSSASPSSRAQTASSRPITPGLQAGQHDIHAVAPICAYETDLSPEAMFGKVLFVHSHLIYSMLCRSAWPKWYKDLYFSSIISRFVVHRYTLPLFFVSPSEIA